MSAKKLFVVCVMGMCLFCVSELAWAQENRGAITGTVFDATGAVVPDVAITVTDINRGLKFPVNSAGAGIFTVPSLTVGQYRVEAQKEGFKRFVQEPVTVFTGSTTTVNITLQLGTITEVVSVSGSPSLLQTTDATVGGVMEGKMYRELPLTMTSTAAYGSGRRQPEQFILIEPGVSTTSEGDLVNKTFNGGQVSTGLAYVDGVTMPHSLIGGQMEMVSPPYESMEEFKVQTADLPAEFGGGSGLEQLTMRSGTNAWHGDLFEFLRNKALNARGFTSLPVKPQLNMNEFGGTIGGPISIPKIYNGHDRTFFFASVEDYRQLGAPPSTPTYTVPTAAETQGDFSALLVPANGGIQIYDPSTTTFNAATGTYTRTPFTNNIIGPIVSQASYFLPQLRPPNLPGTNGGTQNNFRDNQAARKSDWVWSVKVDHSFNERHRISWSYWGDNTTDLANADYYFIDSGTDIYWWHGGGHRLHDYYSFRPNVQNDFYAGYSEMTNPYGCAPGAELDAVNPAKIPNLQYYYPQGTGQMRWAGTAPIQYFRSGDGLNSCFNMGVAGVFRGQWQSYIAIGDLADILHGRHNIKFGFETNREYNTARTPPAGQFQFAGLETGLPGVPKSGDAFASFLLGQVDATNVTGPPNYVQYHNYRTSAFVQDTFRVTTKLTINYGLRYELPYVTTTKGNTLSGFDPLALNPGAVTSTGQDLPGAMVFLGNGVGRTGTSVFRGVHGSKTEFGPRLGIAYALNSKTAIRTGYAMMFTYGNGTAILYDEGGNSFLAGQTQYAANLVSPNNGVTPATTLMAGIPAPTHGLPVINASLQNGSGIMYWDPNSGKEPYIQQWTFGIQRYLPAGFFVTASYVGNKGTRLTGDEDNIDQLPSSYLSLGSLLTQPYNSAAAIAAGINAPFVGFSGTVAQALRPFPQYSLVGTRFDGSGMNRYDALQMQVLKQAGDLHVMVNFTGQKNMANMSSSADSNTFGPNTSRDAANLRLEKSLQSQTFSRQLVASWVYEMPFGKGKRYASGAHGVVNQLIGGWQAGAIQNYRNGFPRSVGGGVPLPIFNGATLPNELAGVPIQLQSCSNVNYGVTVLANINAFANNGPYQIGDAPRVLPRYRSCGWLSEDFSLQKSFPITEKVHLEFRSEFYNVFNRHKFGSQNLTLSNTATFGKITSMDTALQPRLAQLAMKLIW